MSVNIVVPEVGESIVDARVAKWLKREGDAVEAGEAVVELETDKIDLEVSAPRKGVLQSIAHADGADVKIGDVLGTIDEAAAAKPAPAPATAAEAGDGRAGATPSARKLARERDVAIGDVKAAGPRVTKADVARQAAGKAQGPEPKAQAAKPERSGLAPPKLEARRREERIRMSKRRATIARRLVEAQQAAAMLTTFNEVDMSAVMRVRERRKEAFKAKHGVGLGIASFFVKASIAALRAFPRLNAEIQGDEMVLKHYYDIGVAVSTDDGLVVPVLRDADGMTFAEIEQAIRGFATRARDGALTLDDIRGGTFSITNGGVFGSLNSTPILNPPQVGILGLHAIKERPVGVDGQIVLRPMMNIALTYDHRIVDGAEAVQFLVRVKELVEDPGVMLVES
jgi:2-oxoglutarate dehydrogenase E2 component (dihydrolipoamide succinyltransferase)